MERLRLGGRENAECRTFLPQRSELRSPNPEPGPAASLPSWDPGGQPAGRAGPRGPRGEGLRQRLRSRPVGTWGALLGRPGPRVPPCRPALPAPAPALAPARAPAPFHILFRWLCGRRDAAEQAARPVSRDRLPRGRAGSSSRRACFLPPPQPPWREGAQRASRPNAALTALHLEPPPRGSQQLPSRWKGFHTHPGSPGLGVSPGEQVGIRGGGLCGAGGLQVDPEAPASLCLKPEHTTTGPQTLQQLCPTRRRIPSPSP